MRKYLFGFILSLSFYSSLYAQYTINGNAVQTGADCYRLTDALQNQAGSVWHSNLIDLKKNFSMNARLNLGCLDGNGADGIAFVMQPISTALGTAGGGIGYEGISPSVSVEFDTWQNADRTDPSYDHIAIMKNGVLDHSTANNLAGPVRVISDLSDNVEDCNDHAVNFIWDALKHKLSVYVDCSFRVSYTEDIVKDIFSNNSKVYIGFTSATGGSFNVQSVCFDYFTAVDSLPDQKICLGDSVKITAPTGFTSYKWTPSTDVSNPNSSNPYFSPTVSTLYTLTMTDACNLIIKDQVWVNVVNIGFAGLGNDIGFCQGESYTFNAFTPGCTYLWKDGTTASSCTAQNSGIYWVDVTKDGCTVRDSVLVTVYQPPVADFNVIPVCLGDSGYFPESSMPGSSAIAGWLWDFGDGFTSSMQSPAHFYSAAGTYDVKLFVVDQNGCRDSLIKQVGIYGPPVAAFLAPATCQSDSALFNDSSFAQGGMITAWFWDFGDGSTSSVQNPAHLYSLPGTYNVQLIVQNQNGCSDTVSGQISIYEVPVAAFSAASVCLYDSVFFSDSSTSSGGIAGWSWDFGDGSISLTKNPAHRYQSSGIYAVMLEVFNMQGCKGTIIKNITVEEPLELSINSDTSIKKGSSALISAVVTGGSGQYQYQWNPDLGPGPGPYEVKPDSTTTYYLTVTDAAGIYCPAVSGAATIQVYEDCEKASFRIPNAFSPNGDGINDSWKVINNECFQLYNIRIYNRWGELILELSQKEESAWNGGWRNDLSEISPSGAYVFVLVYTEKTGRTQKITGTIALTE